MRILFVITRGDTIAGAQRNVLDLAEAFKTDHEVVVASSDPDGPFAQAVREQGIRHVEVDGLAPGGGAFQIVRATRSLDRLFQEFRPDLAHGHSTLAGFLTRLVARRHHVPSVFTAHGWAFTTGVPGLHRLLGSVIEAVARPLGGHVVTVSTHDYELGRRWRVAPESRLNLIEYGIPDLTRPSEAPAGAETPMLLMAARFEQQKDHGTLIRALAQVRDLEWEVRFAGDGPLRGEMEQLAEECGVADRVVFLGYVSNVDELLQEASVYALVTNYEGLPISIIEALRASRPVIGTDVGGIAQMVLDGETGFLVRRHDAESVAGALRRALEDPGWVRTAGVAARAHYERLFAVDVMVERMADLYERART